MEPMGSPLRFTTLQEYAMTVSVTIDQNNRSFTLKVPKEKPLVFALRQEGLIVAPCGIGKCGKCRILCETVPTDEEKTHLTPMELEAGVRLACYTYPKEGMRIGIIDIKKTRVQTGFKESAYALSPALKKIAFTADKPDIEHQHTDIQRVLLATHATGHRLSLKALRRLPDLLRQHNHSAYAVLENETLVDICSHSEHYGMVVDIGTTTVAALLIDLTTGKTVAVDGAHNAQAPFGADVMTRIQYAMDGGLERLTQGIIKQLNTLLSRLLEKSGAKDVSLISIAGNTTMMHLLCGINPEHISKAPFIPGTLEAMTRSARDLGIHSSGQCYLLPGVSAYIGADIVASLIATGAVGTNETFLMADIGTNAETVLYANGTCYACSAAAGPCFEGANLSCGMPGQPGAIDSVFEAEKNGFGFTVIDDKKAVGLCGSGVIDGIALLLNSGAVEPTGRLHAKGSLSQAITGEKNEIRFNLTDTVAITQKDIREVQLAKAALRSGIEILMREAGITADEIDTLYLAGGFGSAIHPESAVRIGMIPQALLPKISVLGNAASYGALRYVTEKEADQTARIISSASKHIELSAHAGFSNEYMGRMLFAQD